MAIVVGRVIRSSTTRFAVACQVLRPEVPIFGSLVKVRALGDEEVFGLIHDVRMEDDPFVRQMSIADGVPPETIEDMRLKRLVPIEVDVLVVGYRRAGTFHHRLPPQPPVSLDVIYTCTKEEVRSFTDGFGYFRLVLESADVPADELLAANVRFATEVRASDGYGFAVDAGRELARLLSADLGRLDALLRRIRP
jgi:hypothetical protein